MQVVISLPCTNQIEGAGGIEQALFRKVGGIPLLVRVAATAIKSGATEVLLLHPKCLPESELRAHLNFRALPGTFIQTVALDKAFDPDDPSDWQVIGSRLESKFLWLPWNYVADTKLLSRLIATGNVSESGVHFEWPQPTRENGGKEAGLLKEPFLGAPTVIVKKKLGIAEGSAAELAGAGGRPRCCTADFASETIPVSDAPGVAVFSSRTALEAERELVRRSGKDTDGIYSRFNRWLSRPAVRFLARTPVTPNVVTFAGLGVALLSAYCFAQGYWAAYVLGALLFFVSVLFDEIDGMLARITFRESAFGCWLETFVDYASYVLLFAGMTLGLYRQSGRLWLGAGGVLLLGALTSFVVVGKQRKLVTDPEKPQEYRARMYRRLEADKGNLVSQFGRQVEFLIRKPAICHFVILFTVFGAIKVLFLIAVFGANLVWPLVLYFNRFFSRPVVQVAIAMKGASEA